MKKLYYLVIVSFVTLNLHALDSVKKLSFEQKILSHEKLNEFDEQYNTIASVEVREVGMLEDVILDKDSLQKANIGAVIMTVEKLLALGTKIWDIVKKGRPVVTMNFATPISVLPKTDDPNSTFFDMENWSAPNFRKYKVEFKNLFGSVVVGFTYTVQFQHSGTYEGKGQYITGLSVNASDVAVSWGFEFDASSALITISNRGRRDNPLAAATVKIDYTAKSVLRQITSSESFHVTGNGQVSKF